VFAKLQWLAPISHPQVYLRSQRDPPCFSPIAPRCIAQVHRATFNAPRRPCEPSSGAGGAGGAAGHVVVKVLHPGVRAQVAADLDLLAAAAWALEHLPRLGLQYLSLRQLVGEFDKVRSIHLKTQKGARASTGLGGPLFFCVTFSFFFHFFECTPFKIDTKILVSVCMAARL
jgi:hypothetical protein